MPSQLAMRITPLIPAVILLASVLLQCTRGEVPLEVPQPGETRSAAGVAVNPLPYPVTCSAS